MVTESPDNLLVKEVTNTEGRFYKKLAWRNICRGVLLCARKEHITTCTMLRCFCGSGKALTGSRQGKGSMSVRERKAALSNNEVQGRSPNNVLSGADSLAYHLFCSMSFSKGLSLCTPDSSRVCSMQPTE